MNNLESTQFFKTYYDEQLIIVLELLIKYSFPKIENLNIVKEGCDNLSIAFSKGVYTKEEVESKLDEFITIS